MFFSVSLPTLLGLVEEWPVCIVCFRSKRNGKENRLERLDEYSEFMPRTVKEYKRRKSLRWGCFLHSEQRKKGKKKKKKKGGGGGGGGGVAGKIH